MNVLIHQMGYRFNIFHNLCLVNKAIIIFLTLLISQPAFSQFFERTIFVPGIQMMDFRNEATHVHNLGYGLDMTISIPGKDFLKLDGTKHGGMILFNTWLSGGVNFINAAPSKVYVEAGISYVLNIGIGYSSVNISDFRDKYYHLFLGLPIPIPIGSNLTKSILFEPYVRCKLTRNLPFAEIDVIFKYPIFVQPELW